MCLRRCRQRLSLLSIMLVSHPGQRRWLMLFQMIQVNVDYLERWLDPASATAPDHEQGQRRDMGQRRQ
jgi:hypothetical protein